MTKKKKIAGPDTPLFITQAADIRNAVKNMFYDPYHIYCVTRWNSNITNKIGIEGGKGDISSD